MTRIFKLLILPVVLLALPALASAQSDGDGYKVFVPISKYIEQGDAEKLSAWFADNLEITLISDTTDSSRSQAKQILSSFFSVNRPSSFTIEHKAAKANMKYALGKLEAGAETYKVTIFVSLEGSDYKIQQLKIERFK